MENNENNFTNNTTNNEEEKLRMEGTQKKKGNPIGIIAIILLIVIIVVFVYFVIFKGKDTSSGKIEVQNNNQYLVEKSI